MKNSLLQHSKHIIFGIFILTSYLGTAQVTYEDQLETVYLNKQSEEVVYTNDFSNFNKRLLSKSEIDFRVEIKNAKENDEYLLFLSERSNLELLNVSYLKTVRKGANRSTDAEDFAQFLREKLPELTHQFKKDNNIEELYIISRKNTFNGKIDALPSVL